MDKKAVRDLFPVTRNLIYFNHAAVGRSLRGRPRRWAACAISDHGAPYWREWYAEDAALRDRRRG
jgi:hypothetical protein